MHAQMLPVFTVRTKKMISRILPAIIALSASVGSNPFLIATTSVLRTIPRKGRRTTLMMITYAFGQGFYSAKIHGDS